MKALKFGGLALAAALAFGTAALAQSDATGTTAELHGPRIGTGENCKVMKQRILAVSDARTDVAVSPGRNTGNVVNNSGSTVMSDAAKRNVMEGDAACAHNDLTSARMYYQRALNDLSASH